jgi:hypothetical protein
MKILIISFVCIYSLLKAIAFAIAIYTYQPKNGRIIQKECQKK